MGRERKLRSCCDAEVTNRHVERKGLRVRLRAAPTASEIASVNTSGIRRAAAMPAGNPNISIQRKASIVLSPLRVIAGNGDWAAKVA
jgi:hypothetical protein